MDNIEKTRQELIKKELGALMITTPVNRLFTAGFISSAGVLLITENDAWYFTDSRYVEAAEASVKNARVQLVTNEENETYYARVKAILEERSITLVGFEDEAVTYSEYQKWTKKLRAELVPLGGTISDMRAVKTSGALEKMKKAQLIAEKSFEEVLPLIGKDITEKQLAAELVYRFMKNGADDKAFDPIIVSGPRSSMPHGVPGDDKICDGFLTIDFGAKLDSWCSDTTRTVCIGKPDDEMIKVYGVVLEAQEAGIKAAHAGAKCSDVDSAARAVISDAGYGPYFGHGFGHGLGLEVHEAPTASKTSEDVLSEGSVISAEPGVYLPGRFGVRIEDVLYITGDGCENITNLTKKLIVL